MLRAFGATQVSVLNGSYAKWEKEGLAIDMEEYDDEPRERNTEPEADDFDYKLNEEKLARYEKIVNGESHKILDSRFGRDYEQGHITNSLSLPFPSILEGEFKTLKSREDLIEIFKSQGGIVDPENEKVILSCQRGVTACVLELALASLGNPNTSVYDGSYGEWLHNQ